MTGQPEPSPPSRNSFILDAAALFLNWFDKPWKFFAIAGLAILIAFGWGGWLSRESLIDAWKMTSGRPILKESEMPDTLKRLRMSTSADIVAFWRLQLWANGMYFKAGFSEHGEPWIFKPERLDAIRDPGNQTPGGYSDLVAGQIVCRTPREQKNGDLFERRMGEEKISFLCLVPVPPAPNILVGILLLAWLHTPDNPTLAAAKGIARETASTMVSRWE